MTQLKPSEKRLLIFFGIAAFILLNLLGFSWLKKRNVLLERQRITVESRIRELEMWQGKAAEAEQKRSYLDQHLQAYADEATRETYLDDFIKREASDLDLEVRKNVTMPALLEEHFHKSRYTAEVSGSWDDIFEFIYRLQQPKEFRFVRTLRLKSQKKEGSSDEAADAVCTFEIEKWWSPESAHLEDVFTAPATAAAAAEAAEAAPPAPEATPPALAADSTAEPVLPKTEQTPPEAVPTPETATGQPPTDSPPDP
jgi:hypothetical protein